uniref:Uncharacterized protein n=1 Tax=Arundo donax TaxID=35708 RepID=A0A0A8XVD4_ARUDO
MCRIQYVLKQSGCNVLRPNTRQM